MNQTFVFKCMTNFIVIEEARIFRAYVQIVPYIVVYIYTCSI